MAQGQGFCPTWVPVWQKSLWGVIRVPFSLTRVNDAFSNPQGSGERDELGLRGAPDFIGDVRGRRSLVNSGSVSDVDGAVERAIGPVMSQGSVSPGVCLGLSEAGKGLNGPAATQGQHQGQNSKVSAQWPKVKRQRGELTHWSGVPVGGEGSIPQTPRGNRNRPLSVSPGAESVGAVQRKEIALQPLRKGGGRLPSPPHPRASGSRTPTSSGRRWTSCLKLLHWTGS